MEENWEAPRRGDLKGSSATLCFPPDMSLALDLSPIVGCLQSKFAEILDFSLILFLISFHSQPRRVARLSWRADVDEQTRLSLEGDPSESASANLGVSMRTTKMTERRH